MVKLRTDGDLKFGLIDAGLFHGFPYADAACCGSSIMVVAKEGAQKAAEELGITIDKDHPVHIELSYPSSVNQYANRANALKKSVETSTDGAIIVDLLDCVSLKNWYYDGYYTQSGDQCNYNVYDCSGWGPDYGDPQTYLNTFQKEIGDMIHVLGIY